MEMIQFELIATALTGAAISFVIVCVLRDNRHNATQEIAIRQWMAQQYGPGATGVQMCESCRQHPATVTVTVRDAPAFAVCRDCAPTAAHRPAVIVLPRAGSDRPRLAAPGERSGIDAPAAH